MKKTDLSNVVANVRGIVLEDKTIQHLIEAYQEGFEALLSAIGCDPAEITILSGAATTQASQDYTVAAGWVAYQGEIFEVDASAFTAPGGQVGVWSIVETFAATDPVKFDDGNEYNVNQIRKMALVAGLSGSGLKDWDDVANGEWKPLTLLNGALESGAAVVVGSRQAASYRKDFTGRVHLTGVVALGTSGIIATLPVGFRPVSNVSLGYGHAQGFNAFPRILTDGTIDFLDSTSSAFLDGISFPSA